MADFKSMAMATSPREFDLPSPMTIEELFEKLNAHASAFKMNFNLKEGLPGKRISFDKDPELDVALWIFIKDGIHVKINPVIKENTSTVNGIRVDKNSVMRKGVSGVANLPLERGEYIDSVMNTVQKIINDEPVSDYVAPVDAGGQNEKNWLVALLLCLFLGGIGAHRFYAGKVGSGILYILTVGVFGIGVLVDLIKILTGKFTDKDGNPIQKK